MKVAIAKNNTIEEGGTFTFNGAEHVVLSVTHLSDTITEIEISDIGGPSAEVALEIDKRNKLNNLTANIDGKVFSVTDESQSRIHRALQMAEEKNLTEARWKLAEEFEGSKIAIVTVDELKRALFAGMYLIGQEVLGD